MLEPNYNGKVRLFRRLMPASHWLILRFKHIYKTHIFAMSEVCASGHDISEINFWMSSVASKCVN